MKVVAGTVRPGYQYNDLMFEKYRDDLFRINTFYFENIEMRNTHLHRLERIWIKDPIFFITTCTYNRNAICHHNEVALILLDEMKRAEKQHGWYIGAYVFMPDHIHFLCRSSGEAKSLSDFMMHWKQWTSKRITRETEISGTVWQAEFFDRLIRSDESYSQKREYIWNNPVRAGLVKEYKDWRWAGELNVF